jgi:uncharacterized protein YqcC (DUF446 family)
MSDTFRTTAYWFRHEPAKAQRHLNRGFRLKEKQYFLRFGEFLKKVQIPRMKKVVTETPPLFCQS